MIFTGYRRNLDWPSEKIDYEYQYREVVLGQEFFRYFYTTLDYDKQTIKLRVKKGMEDKV